MGSSISTHFLKSSDHRIVILGLDNAGKTTILYRMKLQQIVLTQPTVGFNCEKCKVVDGLAKGHSFALWDIGGHNNVRPLWKTYLKAASALVYVIDTSNKCRFDESRDELETILISKELPIFVPILLLANKQDLPGSMEVSELKNNLDIYFGDRVVESMGCCAVTGEGLENIFGMLLYMINRSKHKFQYINKRYSTKQK
uniref:ADP-ribosylation factor-like protein 4C n=1 Tax=Parastrongyloides trichosuri TaxID=131310 RepID=A0A0N4ZCS5_PARTI